VKIQLLIMSIVPRLLGCWTQPYIKMDVVVELDISTACVAGTIPCREHRG